MIRQHKKCFKCGVIAPTTEFYRHPEMGDGLLGKCKCCARKDVKINRDKKWAENGILRSDHFPDKRSGEKLIETEAEAWVLAGMFARKTQSERSLR
jgi:hypothetical protein